MKYVYGRDGEMKAFIDNDNLFSSDGKHIGFIRNNKVYNLNGNYLGIYYDNLEMILVKSDEMTSVKFVEKISISNRINNVKTVNKVKKDIVIPVGYFSVF